jgi:hypothetical protein
MIIQQIIYRQENEAIPWSEGNLAYRTKKFTTEAQRARRRHGGLNDLHLSV